MTDIKAKTISDSIGEHSPRLWTVETRVPQMIHQEILRHRRIITEEGLSVLGLGWEPDFSYSVSSTRAVPFAKMVQEAMDDDLRAAPIHWGRANKGMVPGDELDDIEKNIWWPTVVLGLGLRGGDEIPQEFITRMECAERLWRISAWFAATAAKQMVNHCDPHKSIPNRMIAPYTHYNVLMTGTEPGWLNLFGLRLDGAADPIVRALAEILWREWNESKPRKLDPHQWHLPYADDDQSYEEALNYITDSVIDPHNIIPILRKMSVARCAHLSYSSFETGDRMTVEQCINLHYRLIGSVPLHVSPAEHQATPDADYHPAMGGNLGPGWIQYRKLLPNEAVAPLPKAYR